VATALSVPQTEVVAAGVALGEESYIHNFGGEIWGKDRSGDIGVHRRIMLKCMLKWVRRV
jgi:hypothetical protein